MNMLKLIQLGLTFTDENGNLPRVNNELCVWQFNFRCAICHSPAAWLQEVILCFLVAVCLFRCVPQLVFLTIDLAVWQDGNSA